MIQVYGIKNCDSVKKAIKFLKAKGLDYNLNDFKTDTVSCDKVEPWLQKSDIKTLFNTRGTTYRTLKLKEMNLDDTQKAQWLCKENMLIKRPVIEYNDTVIVGFNENQYKEIFQ